MDGALTLTRAYQPRVIVLDLNMPGEPTLSAIPRFLEGAPETAILVLTMETEPGFARRALAAGARGYVLKERAESELVEAIRAVIAGRTYLDPTLGAQLAQTVSEPPAAALALARDDPRLAVGSNFAGHRIDAFVAAAGWAWYSGRQTTRWSKRWRSR